MKPIALFVLAAWLSVHTFAQQNPVPKGCRIVDVTITKGAYNYFVDGQNVSSDIGVVLNSLRRAEAALPSTCLRVFVPLAATLRDVENFHIIAGKMQFEAFHVYLYDESSEFADNVNEVDIMGKPEGPARELRKGVDQVVPWPNSSAKPKKLQR